MTNLDLKCDCNEGYFELVSQLHQCEVCGLDSPPVAVTKKELGPDEKVISVSLCLCLSSVMSVILWLKRRILWRRRRILWQRRRIFGEDESSGPSMCFINSLLF